MIDLGTGNNNKMFVPKPYSFPHAADNIYSYFRNWAMDNKQEVLFLLPAHS